MFYLINFIVCVDDRMGVAFNRRLLSRDKYIDGYLEELSESGRVVADNNYIKYIDNENYENSENISEEELRDNEENINIFCSSKDTLSYSKIADRVTVFFWNRRYPSDVQFDYDYVRNNFQLQKHEDDIEGSTHSLTMEIWIRK